HPHTERPPLADFRSSFGPRPKYAAARRRNDTAAYPNPTAGQPKKVQPATAARPAALARMRNANAYLASTRLHHSFPSVPATTSPRLRCPPATVTARVYSYVLPPAFQRALTSNVNSPPAFSTGEVNVHSVLGSLPPLSPFTQTSAGAGNSSTSVAGNSFESMM